MRIVISLSKDLSGTSGTQVRVKSVAEILEEKHSITFIAEKGRGLPVLSTLLRILRLAIAVLIHRFDIIYCAEDFLGFPVYYLLSKILGYKLIYDAHGIPSEEPYPYEARLRRKVYRTLEKLIARHADCITAVGENMLRYYQRYSQNVSLVPLFVDETVFKRNKGSQHQSQRDYKLIGLVGPFTDRHWEIEKLEFLYGNLDKFDRRINFVVIGDCDCRIESDRIRYMGYLDSVQAYIDQLCLLDAALVYKEPERGPYTKTIEAMACRLPVFTTPIGMVGFEKATPGEDILVFKKEELVTKINELIFNEELMQQIGEKARLTVEKYYSKAANRERILDIIDRVCRG